MSSPGSGPEETTRHEAEAAFGRLAVALGYVTPEQLRAAEREHASRGSSGERPALGQILLERGSLTGAQYAAVLRSQRAGSTAGAAPGAVPASIGKYLVTGWLGRGGMATVYEAMDPDLRRPVALKVLRPGSGDEPDRLERLRREAAAAARIRHPNLVAVHEVGSAAQADGSIAHYIAMDLVRGSTLADEMDGLSRAEQVRILAVVARATDHAHRAGVVHRDLKPQNVLLERGPGGDLHPYLTDFGLARLGGDEDLTKTGTAVGTPYYMAPEQVRGEHRRMGPATDVWALGVMLYEMTVRRKPFAGSSALVVYDQILRQEPVPPARIRRGLPADLLRIAGVAMSKDPASRHASAAEFAEDLERWLAGERVACGRPG